MGNQHRAVHFQVRPAAFAGYHWLISGVKRLEPWRLSMVSRVLLAGVLVTGALTAGAVSDRSVAADSPNVTFHKDVEPILQKNCQTCHRPGQVAPMSFPTYQS